MNKIRFTTLALCLLTAVSSFALSIGPEIPVQEPPIVPPPGVRGAPLVASNGDGFLVVWNDWRGGRDEGEVRVARVDANGVVVDGQSRLVAGRNMGAVTSVASNGRDYLIAYNCTAVPQTDLCLARVDALTGAVIAAGTIDGMNGALASNGNGYLLVYQNGSAGSVQPLVGVALREDGSPLRAPFPIAASAYGPSVTSNGERYFVVWSTYAQLEGVLVSDTAVVAARQGFSTTVPSAGPGPFSWSVASDGDGFLVAWQQNTGIVERRYTTELRVAPVSANGVASASRAVVGKDAWQPALAWKGTDYLLTYTHSTVAGLAPSFGGEEGDVRALALTRDGAPIAGTAYAESGGRESGTSIGAGGATTLVAWHFQSTPSRDFDRIEGRLAEREGTFVIATAPAWQHHASLQRRAGSTVVAWEEITGHGQVSRVRLHQYENSIAPPPGRATFDIPPAHRHQRRPVVRDGMVAWIEEELDGSKASVWFHGLDYGIGRNIAPVGRPEKVGDAKPGTQLHVLRTHGFHVILWTAPDGRIAGVFRSLIARIGYDPSVFYVTNDQGIHPASDGNDGELIAYNNLVRTEDPCAVPCPARYGVRVTTLFGMKPQPALDVAPAGTLAPRVVQLAPGDYLVFWSMDDRKGTMMQRVSVAAGVAALVGAPREIHGGLLHDATLGKDNDVYVVVEEPGRYAVLRLDRSLSIVETIPFHAQLARDARIEISAHSSTRPMLAYAARRENDGASSRIVLRHVDDNIPVPKRRSAR